jgi:hypothetical protein
MITIGTENKKATKTAIVLLIVAALLLYRGLHAKPVNASAQKAPSGAQAVSASSKARSRRDHGYVGFLLRPTLDPHLRVDLLADSEGTAYQGNGRDIFSDREEEIPIPKPVASGLIAKADTPPAWQTTPAAPPPAPDPISLKFWGWANVPGETKAVFLVQGENGFVAHEGDIVARRYKVEKIGSSSVEIEDMLSNNRQSIPVSF